MWRVIKEWEVEIVIIKKFIHKLMINTISNFVLLQRRIMMKLMHLIVS
jgi:hypothetical protein